MSTSADFPDKDALRRSLEQAAHSYDNASFLQREIADRLFSRLEYVKLNPRRILDIGCRTGYGTRKLASHYDQATIIALETAHSMLRHARGQSPWWKHSLRVFGSSKTRYLCADPAHLPLAANSIDLVWSNLALHSIDPAKSMAEAHRVLAANKLFTFTTLGPDTLKELRGAFAGIDTHGHIHRFIDMHDIGDTLLQVGFTDPVMDMEIITITFADLVTLVNDLKSLGERNRLTGRRPGLMTPRQWQKVTGRYESLRDQGNLPVTVEVIYGHAWKPQETLSSDGRKIIQFRDYPRNNPSKL